MSGFDANDLTPGIRQTVVWLRDHGFHTTDSGDGVTNVESGMEYALPFPHVFMTCTPEVLIAETQRLQDLLTDMGVEVEPLGPENTQLPHLEATYDPCDNLGFIALSGVDDDLLFGGAKS